MVAVGQEPLILGETVVLHSHILDEPRALNIVLPAGYQADDTTRYPVIYLLDGGVDEDLIHVAGALQFATFEWIGWQQPSILVGIVNVDRRRDLTHPSSVATDMTADPTAGRSAMFMDFIGSELCPFIEKRYRTGSARILIGQSLGGLFAAEVLIKRPELFTDLVIVSPSLWWDNGSVLQVPPAFAHRPAQAPAQVFIAVGKEGRVMERGAKRLATLAARSRGTRVEFTHLRKHDHANILHQAVLDAFRWMGENP